MEHPVEYLRAGKLTVQKNGRQLTVASWNDEEMGRTRTPGGHTVIALSPPLKLVHAPFVFTIEVAATQSVGCELNLSPLQPRPALFPAERRPAAAQMAAARAAGLQPAATASGHAQAAGLGRAEAKASACAAATAPTTLATPTAAAGPAQSGPAPGSSVCRIEVAAGCALSPGRL